GDRGADWARHSGADHGFGRLQLKLVLQLPSRSERRTRVGITKAMRVRVAGLFWRWQDVAGNDFEIERVCRVLRTWVGPGPFPSRGCVCDRGRSVSRPVFHHA